MRSGRYRFDADDTGDWIAQHFFTGGRDAEPTLIHQFPDLFAVEADWRWSGAHYRATAEDWLANFDRNLPTIEPGATPGLRRGSAALASALAAVLPGDRAACSAMRRRRMGRQSLPVEGGWLTGYRVLRASFSQICALLLLTAASRVNGITGYRVQFSCWT